MIGVYVPTYGRPRSLQRLVDNIHEATETPHRIVFAVEKEDTISQEAAWATGAQVVVNKFEEPSYSNSFQTAYESFDDPYFIAANDDFDFQHGWDVAALKLMRPPVYVVGIHDGSPGCEFETIALVARRYIEEQSGVVDIPNRVFFTYRHNYVDTEFARTAQHREVFVACPDSVILHKHPDWGYVADDATYKRSKFFLSVDGNTYNTRAHLWAR